MVSQNQRSASQLLMVTQSPLVMFIALNVLYFLFNVLNLFISKAFLCICLAIQQWFLDIFCCCLAVLLMFHTICFYLFSFILLLFIFYYFVSFGQQLEILRNPKEYHSRHFSAQSSQQKHQNKLRNMFKVIGVVLSAFVVNFENISHRVPVFLLIALNM